jgi:hypothetical protein
MSVEADVQGEVLDEHEQAMVDLVDTKEAEAVGNANPEEATDYIEPEEPEAIDYKAEYERMVSEKEVVTPETEEVTPEPPKEAPAEDAGLITPDALDKYSTEFNKDGGISEESYKELKDQGYSKAIVDNYIQGQAAISQAQNQRVFDKTGGPEEYNNMVTWAKDSWSPEQVSVFNDQVNSGDEAQIMYGVDALTSQYKAANTGMPQRALKGSSGGGESEGSRGYADKGEMFKAMNNRLYGRDASYTNSVAKKIGLSKF